ncbi:MAG: hypothetical protein D6748_06180 [Calditrichaeota bacterium]|nr:MAG: hypothetical protein D6748_06180 [Calditrichota bacterium]
MISDGGMKTRKFFILLTILLLFTSTLHLLRYTRGEKAEISVHLFNRTVTGKLQTLFYDPHDLTIYFEIAKWFTSPSGTFQEIYYSYPPLANLVFTIPYQMMNMFLISNADLEVQKNIYFVIFSLLMVVLASMAIHTVYSLRKSYQWMAYFMLLPACYYMTLNRFDILPAYLTLLSLQALLRGREKWAFFWLTLGMMIKWYPAVLIPVFLRFLWDTNRDKIKSSLIYLAGYMAVGHVLLLIFGGVKAITLPYMLQLDREINQESLMYLMTILMGTKSDGNSFLHYFFVFMQILIPSLVLLVRVNTPRRLCYWSGISITAFILFSPIYSPQWILWIMPFLLLCTDSPVELIPIILFDGITYLYFPFIYGNKALFPGLFITMMIIKTMILAYFMFWLYRKANTRFRLESEQSC